jgi:hypothetical protein
MKTAYFAILLLTATAAGAQSQTTTAQTQTTAPAQGQSSSCGLACAMSDTPATPSGESGTVKLPRNLAKLAQNKSDLDKVVCEAQESLGTRLGAKKVCMTVAQWIEFQNDVKDQTRRIEILGHVSH